MAYEINMDIHDISKQTEIITLCCSLQQIRTTQEHGEASVVVLHQIMEDLEK